MRDVGGCKEGKITDVTVQGHSTHEKIANDVPKGKQSSAAAAEHSQILTGKLKIADK